METRGAPSRFRAFLSRFSRPQTPVRPVLTVPEPPPKLGLALGIAGALVVTRLMTGLLYQTEPLDVATFASVTGVLAAVGLLSCYLPARRAARVEPMAATAWQFFSNVYSKNTILRT